MIAYFIWITIIIVISSFLMAQQPLDIWQDSCKISLDHGKFSAYCECVLNNQQSNSSKNIITRKWKWHHFLCVKSTERTLKVLCIAFINKTNYSVTMLKEQRRIWCDIDICAVCISARTTKQNSTKLRELYAKPVKFTVLHL